VEVWAGGAKKKKADGRVKDVTFEEPIALAEVSND
jgi:hypothetical protein